MTSPDNQLIAVPANSLAALHAEIRAVRILLENSNITPPDPWRTMEQICADLGCSHYTIRRRVETGEILAQGTGKTRRYRQR